MSESNPSQPGEETTTSKKSLKHDLRTPLNQILGYSQMVAEEAEEREQQDLVPDLRKIETAGRKLLEMIDDLFDAEKGGPLAGVTHFGQPPAAAPAAAPPAAAPAPAAAPSRPSASLEQVKKQQLVRTPSAADGPESLLIVDDNEMNRDMLARRFERRGFKVEVAVDGFDALEKIDKTPYDLILLDIMMPGLSGIDVLKKVRETTSQMSLPIVMATAKDTSEDVVEALQAGANDYVTKPIDFPVALARVQGQLSLKRANDEILRLAEQLEVRNRFIRQTFGRYLSDEIVESLLESPEGLELGGEKRKVTILMSDLRGFSAIAERLPPEQVVRVINNYLAKMTDVIFEFRGTIDEFIGDAVLAIFGAPITRPDDARRAVACALSMQRAMVEVNAQNRAEGLPEVEMGIAVNTGEVVVGNIGSVKRTKYGVVGSHVNLASRIETYTVGGQILVAASTVEESGDDVELGDSILVQAKGFPEPVPVHDLRGIGGEYQIKLTHQTLPVLPLGRPEAVQFVALEGKHVGGETHAGSILALSREEADMKSDAPLELLVNLKINWVDGSGAAMPGDVYAKVTAALPGRPDVRRIRFTSIPPNVETHIVALADGAAGAG